MYLSDKQLIDSVIIDGDDADEITTTTNFKIKLPITGKNIGHYYIKSVMIPLTMDNVTATGSGANNVFQINDVNQTITVGQYNVNSLIAEMNTLFTSYTFTYTNNGRIKIKYKADDITTFKFEPVTDACAWLLGFTNTAYTGANSYTGEYPPVLSPTYYFTLHSTYIANKGRYHIYHSDKRNDQIMYIPITNDIGSTMIFMPDNPEIVTVDLNNFDLIDFQLRDEFNQVVNLGRSSFIIKLERLV